ncbi:hypothetical protein B6U81_03785 [Thermoplasmatales archaeon ex4484_30]|nr:MAG: hypothetical protein B6U81_03785 [Thermoplasmatales archaeon ex4484_30]
MRVYIGSFSDDEAQELLKSLGKIGIKAELRPALYVDTSERYYIKGKMDELKEKYAGTILEEVLKKWDNYIKSARSIMEEGMKVKDFEEKFLDTVMPERKEIPSANELIEENLDKDKFEKADEKTKAELILDAIEKANKDKFGKAMEQFAKEFDLIVAIHGILELNEIRYDENDKMHGSLPENPMLKIYVDSDDAEELDLEVEFHVRIEKNVDVYANYIDALFELKKLGELTDEKPEIFDLLIMADIAGMIVDKIEGKIDLEEFIDGIKSLEKNGDKIRITMEAIDEILKSLEKAEIIKIKKGKIFMRK